MKRVGWLSQAHAPGRQTPWQSSVDDECWLPGPPDFVNAYRGNSWVQHLIVADKVG